MNKFIISTMCFVLLNMACQKTNPTSPTSNVAQQTVTLPGNASATLSWTAQAGQQLGFLIEQSKDGLSFSQIQTVLDGINNVTITGLLAGQKYFFRVRSYNLTGDSPYSTVVNVTK
jgi:hypothetical protein